MNVYDKAHELARAILENPIYKSYKKALDSLNNNPENRRMVEDFRKKQLELQMIELSGQKPDEQKISHLQKLYEILMANSEIKNFLESEMNFSKLMADVYKIISDTLDLEIQQ